MISSAAHVDLEANTPIYRRLSPGILKVKELFSIREAFKGTNVLITGANTFVGSLAAAQLLAGCPEVGRVWLLVQSSERKTVVPQLASLIEQSIRNRRYEALFIAITCYPVASNVPNVLTECILIPHLFFKYPEPRLAVSASKIA